MSPSPGEAPRERDLQAIRDTYAGYRRTGRHQLWDLENPGFRRLIHDRDLRLVALLHGSVPTDGTARVLDLGSGDGRLAQVASDAGLRLGGWVGVDLDPEAVAGSTAAYPSATFQVASADALPFADGTFDAVICATLFSSLPSSALEQAVASEIERILTRDGWLIWYDLRYDNPRNPAVHGVTRRRLGELFPGWHQELWTETLLPPLARRLGVATPILYPILHAIPTMRSHFVGRLRRPRSG